MKLEIWSDVVCPWCYVGKRNLEAALAQFPHAGSVEIVWRSYELDPSAPRVREGDYETRLSRKYGTTVDQARMMIARIVDAGAGAGLDMRFDLVRGGNTFDAHRLLHLAREHGLQDVTEERFFAATFTEGATIGEVDTLARLGVEAGLPEGEVDDVLRSDRYAADVRADETEAAALEVTGVPFFVADRRYAVSGAQAPDVMLHLLERAWRAANPIEVVSAPGAGMCEGDACDF